MDLYEEIQKSEMVIKKGRYAYVKTGKVLDIDNHFMVSKDEDEVTIVTEENNIKNLKVEKLVGYFKLVEIRANTPFETVGFLAKISETVAKQGLNILIVSTFSKDYILLKEETVQIGLDELKKLGFPIINEN